MKYIKRRFAIANGWDLNHPLMKFYDGKGGLNISKELRKKLAYGIYRIGDELKGDVR